MGRAAGTDVGALPQAQGPHHRRRCHARCAQRRNRMKSLLTVTATALALIAPCLPAIAQEQPGTILVLDASGSMWGQIDGVNKIVIAREVVADILADFPAEQN